MDHTLDIKYDTSEEGCESYMDEEFELVEREEGEAKGNGTAAEESEKPTSLFDPDVKDNELEMKDVTEELEKRKNVLPSVEPPRYLHAPSCIPPLSPFIRTTGIFSQGPLELEIPITELAGKSTTIHQLAAKKATQELEEGRGWLYQAKGSQGSQLKDKFERQFSYMTKREVVRLGVEHQVGGKWCSFVTVFAREDASEQYADGPELEKQEVMDLDEDSDDFSHVGFGLLDEGCDMGLGDIRRQEPLADADVGHIVSIASYKLHN
ncbi:hypothetical protein QQS21_009854 [Conoideocrella luteorostrata]|uniref:Uncharacterized protein n=1 Tax=Conoideocrella luteorostrata TaxID=1105319 RepID=A0AAJ0FV90_9HYPO|nr:hypothetical protein QQS21_009854 [Conoideocrella luteorostrata]